LPRKMEADVEQRTETSWDRNIERKGAYVASGDEPKKTLIAKFDCLGELNTLKCSVKAMRKGW
jgi:hypothetical protein